MSGFTRTFTVTEEFDGDVVTVEMRRLRNEQLVKLAPYFVTAEDGETKVRFKDKVEMLKVGGDVLPEQVVKFDGCKDASGQSLALKDVVGEMYFNELIDRLIGHLFTHSRPEVDEKKSVKPSPALSLVDGSESSSASAASTSESGGQPS